MGLVSNTIPSNNAAIVTSALGALTSLIPYKKNVWFVDAGKTDVTILVGMNGAMDPYCLVTKFPDDTPAVTVEPVSLLRTDRSYAGNIISWDEIEKVRVTLSVIPHTEDEEKLSALPRIQAEGLYGGEKRSRGVVESEFRLGLRISQKKMTKFPTTPIGSIGSESKMLSTVFYDGRLIDVQGGYDSSGKASAHNTTTDCRLSSNRYVFEFGYCKGETTVPVDGRSFVQKLKDAFDM